MIATATLALLAAFGSIGQLLAMILLIYLSLASSGGTVPIQALPGIFNIVGHVEPLRQVVTGTRATRIQTLAGLIAPSDARIGLVIPAAEAPTRAKRSFYLDTSPKMSPTICGITAKSLAHFMRIPSG